MQVVLRVEGEATLDTIANELGVSRERVRQLEAQALDKARTGTGTVRADCQELSSVGADCSVSRENAPGRGSEVAGRGYPTP